MKEEFNVVPNTEVYTTLMNACAQEGDDETTKELFEQMQKERVLPRYKIISFFKLGPKEFHLLF